MVLDAKHGPQESVLNAQQDGTSMPLESAEPSLTNADHGPQLEIAIHAIQVMLSLKDNVFKILTHSSQLPMTSVPFGVTESVLNAPIELSLTQMESAKKYQLNALHGMLLMEFA